MPTTESSPCLLCPRRCGVSRAEGKTGFCGETDTMRIGRTALHFWEEPCISGDTGSGTIFFTGCTLRCVYCQNYVLLRSGAGTPVTEEELVEKMLDLKEQGAANINFVTPDHFLPQIARAARSAKEAGLGIPLVFNISGYETVPMIRMLSGIADIYLTDLKYLDPYLAEKYSHAPDYPGAAKAALREMVTQQPAPVFDENGMMRRGVIVRFLLLPGHVREGRAVLSYLHETYGEQIYVSIMNQYTPRPGIEKDCRELARRVTKREYARLVDHALSIGMENAFIQEGETAKESFIPSFE